MQLAIIDLRSYTIRRSSLSKYVFEMIDSANNSTLQEDVASIYIDSVDFTQPLSPCPRRNMFSECEYISSRILLSGGCAVLKWMELIADHLFK